MEANQLESLFTVPEENIKASKKHNDCYYIKPEEDIKVYFHGDKLGTADKTNRKYRLRMTGEVDLYPFWRNENAFPLLYRLIDDSLCCDITHHSRFSLKLDSKVNNYPKRAYYKITSSHPASDWHNWHSIKSEGDEGLRLGIWFRKDDIRLLQGGRLCFIAEVYYKNTGRHPHNITGCPDEVYTVDMGEGTCDWKENSIIIPLQVDIGSILIYLTGENYLGTLWVEDPYLMSCKGLNLLPPFEPANPSKMEFNWLGHNLSRKEWPEFEISLNGSRIFTGELYQRIYRWPVSEVEIPHGIINKGDNELTIKYISGYREALPYILKKIEIVGFPDSELNIVACPEIVTAGKEFTILVSTGKGDLKAIVESSNENMEPVDEEILFENSGLHAVRFRCLCAGPRTCISFKTGNIEYVSIVERAVEKEEDNVLTGTGDAVYINQNVKDMEYYLSWYLHYRIGNSVTFRPVYRWSGARVLNPCAWERVKKLCNQTGLFYCHMIDGRELPGNAANPSLKLMDGSCFIGSQSHEQDGAFYYWGQKPVKPEDELFLDIWSRTADHSGIFSAKCPVRTKQGMFTYLNPYSADNMEEAACNFIKNIKDVMKNATRHTGPSVLFKYFYQAGVNWLGAELMYGPHEVILAALRGASRAYGKSGFGAHLAVQWSTTPHDSRERYRRYFLALYTSYMHGVQHINTEEGLWRIEEGYSDLERFSTPCVRHREIQQEFYRFIQTHSRRGEIHIAMAFIHGRYDGWVCFTRNQVWMQNGEEWEFSYPEESWDLLKIFYPLSVMDAIYRHPCPDVPQGFYSGTPYGAVDILPIEAGQEVMDGYKILSFLGWNTAEPGQIEKLAEFVKKGGTLLLGWPHLFTGTKRSETMGDTPEILENKFMEPLIGAEFKGFVKTIMKNGNEVNAGEIRLKGATAVTVSNDGLPLVIENRLGEGKVIFVNIKAFPSENCVKNLYSSLLQQMGHNILNTERERGWLKCPENVGFTVYDRKLPEDLRTIYFLDINWWNAGSMLSEVELLWEDRNIELRVYRDCMNILTLSKNWAVWTYDGETDIMHINDIGDSVLIVLQGKGRTQLTILNKNFNNIKYNLNTESMEDYIYIRPDNENENAWKIDMQLNGPLTFEIIILPVQN